MKYSRSLVLSIGAMLSLATADTALAQAGDAAAGEQVFKKCMACHRMGEGAKNLVGPVLNGVLGRQAGTFDGYTYSTINKSAGEAGLVWSEEQVFTYLEDPNAFLRKILTDKGKAELGAGSTKMTFKLADDTERRDVIAYLKKFPK